MSSYKQCHCGGEAEIVTYGADSGIECQRCRLFVPAGDDFDTLRKQWNNLQVWIHAGKHMAKPCAHCGEHYAQTNGLRKYCSDRCCMRAYYARHAA